MSTPVKHLNESNFDKETIGKLCLIDFWATWCGPCRVFAPILEEVAAELPETVLVGKVDVDECNDLAYKFRINSIPTIIIMKDGKLIRSFVGVQGKTILLDALKKTEQL